MSTVSKSDQKKKTAELSWDDILLPGSEKEALESDAQMLMFRFLSEVERYQEVQGVNRKTLAQRIGKSASYLTQVFRGDKPLNLLSLAKMQKALGIRFVVRAEPVQQEVEIEDVNYFLQRIGKYYTKGGSWMYRQHVSESDSDIYNERLSASIGQDKIEQHAGKAISA